jgi:hypothetical protein
MDQPVLEIVVTFCGYLSTMWEVERALAPGKLFTWVSAWLDGVMLWTNCAEKGNIDPKP